MDYLTHQHLVPFKTTYTNKLLARVTLVQLQVDNLQEDDSKIMYFHIHTHIHTYINKYTLCYSDISI